MVPPDFESISTYRSGDLGSLNICPSASSSAKTEITTFKSQIL